MASMYRNWIFVLPAILLSSCLRDAADPFALSPTTSSSTWSPLKGNRLVSSKYCQTLLPTSFGCSELSLAELIDIALQNNPQTQQTWALARSAAAQYGQSLSPFMPNIETNISYMRQSSNFIQLNEATPFLVTQAGPDVTLSYTLFDFGQRTSAAMMAREALYYADLTHNQQIQTTLQSVMNDYYNYLYQKALLKASEADLLTSQTSLDAANEKFALGLAALGDVAQARTQYLQSKINLTTQKQQVEDAFAQLAVDIGLPANLIFQVKPLPEEIVQAPVLESVESLVTAAQCQRQDFLAAQADVLSKKAGVLNAKQATLPVLASSFDIGHYWYDDGAQEKTIHWTCQFNLTFPLFDGFYYKNGVKLAEAKLELSKAKLMQTELSVIQAVTTAHMGIKTAASNLTDTDEYLKAAELEFDIALTNYKSGTKTILDVISAQSSLVDARSKKAGAQKDWFNALASLAYATGSLCATPEENGCK